MTLPYEQPVQGMSDIAPPEIAIWQHIEGVVRRVMSYYAIQEIRTPIVEHAQLFVRSIGDTTDVVQKEMYTFEDRGGRLLSLRPEGTAGVIRYVASLGPEGAGKRFYYIGPMFRSERPQAGRRRQFHQIGVEVIASSNPMTDVEVIALQRHLLSEIGIQSMTLEINTRGETEDRERVAQGLREALKPFIKELCEDCQRRYKENVLRILDCKTAGCQRVVQSLPPVTEFMGEHARSYFNEVLRLLARLEIDAIVNPRLVRGLDYYVHTVWEVRHGALGAQDALAGGGRYRLQFGKASVEGVGFAIGMERLVRALQHDAPDLFAETPECDVWIVSQGPEALQENLVLAQTLRYRGVRCRLDLTGKSMRAQMRAADRSGARFVVIRGDLELQKGVVILRDMSSGSQEELDLAEVLERLTSFRIEPP